MRAGWSIILAFTFTFGILSGQIGFVSLAPVTKYLLIVCYDNQIGNSLIEINTKIVFKFHIIITKIADPFCHSSTLLLIGRQRSRDLFFNPFLAFYWHIFYVFSFFNISYLELVQLCNAKFSAGILRFLANIANIIRQLYEPTDYGFEELRDLKLDEQPILIVVNYFFYSEFLWVW